ncbi:SBBP repeat-containing protein, partial [Dyadobacter sp. OTU695]|uniref:SBBP repeat-containing protein n=1 Tax=Dyadobacter sp. OTU695 TaxID=3043860 RepID=UPI00313F2C11
MKKQLFTKLALAVRRLENLTRMAGNAGLATLCCLLMLWLQPGQVQAQATQDVGNVWVAEPGLVTAGAQAIARGGATDPAGNTYMVGNYFETVDFDPGPGVTPLTEGAGAYAYIQKLDKNKNLSWVKSITATVQLTTNSITVDAAGNLLITGTFRGTADFDPGSGVAQLSTRASNGTETFILKLDSNGNYLWATRLGDTSAVAGSNGAGNEIKTDGSGNIYVAGSFANTVDFNPGAGVSELTSPGGASALDAYVLKLAPDGTFIWARRMGGTFGDNGTSLAVDGDGNVLVGGTINSNSVSDFGTFSVPAVTTQTGFVTKLNSTGTFQWVKTIANTASSSVSDIEVDGTGNIYMGGLVSGTGDLDPGPGTADFPGGGFLAKWDGNGNYAWGMFQGSAVGDITLDNAGNLLATGRYTNAPALLDRDWDPGAGVVKVTNRGTHLASTDIFVSKYTTDAGFVWIKTAGGASATFSLEDGLSVGVDAAGDVYAGGIYSTDAQFGPCKYAITPTANGNIRSQYVWKLSADPVPDLQFAATTLSPASQQACILGIPQVINASPATITSPSGFSTTMLYQWQIAESATGPWTDMPGEVFKDLQPLARNTSAYYRRIVKINDGFCGFKTVDSSGVASVIIGTDVSPIANADGPQWFVCGPGSNTVQLTGTASGGTPAYTYQWYEGSTSTGTPLASTGTWTTPGITGATTYTLQVTDAAGCVDIDQVTIVPAIANAGTDKSTCQGAGGVQIGAPPVSSPSVSYVWTSISGDPISSLSCTTCAQPVANPTAATVYRLTVTVQQKGGATCVTTDDVTVTPVTAPNNTLAFAGTDKTICKNTSVTLGGTADATFAYTWTSGQYLSASQGANPVFNAGTAAVTGGSINYTVTAVKAGCAFTDEVKVSVLNSRITDQDETICGPVWSSHLDEDNAAGTIYTWSVVSGDGTVLQTRNGGKDAYLKSNSGITRFRRTVTLNGVTCTADVLVQPCTGPGTTCDFEILTLSDQGCPKVFGPVALKLGTTLAASDYNFSWSPANLVDNANAATVNITSTAQATITVTVTNKYDGSITCQKSIVINPPGWSLPVFATTDKYTCPNVPVQIGNAAVAGFTYAWTPATGLSSTSVSNPTATVASTQTFAVVVTETASGCKLNTDVTVNSSAPVADAGNDRAVCNGATVTLGTAPPAGSNWTYSWQPVNTAWTNGTDANDAQPQVQFAFATPQSYILTVTDPLSGCTASDTVVLSNTVATGEYAGAGVTTCQGEPVQLGRAAEPFAQYEWFMADGVTPATGLSSNTVANPTVTNPTATTTYVVKVSYPGCNTPLADQITVTVNAVGGLALLDQVVCPAGPIAIGYGATGNPAAPAGATYLWVPAAGLSSATVANPTATVTTETIYSVTVTLPSGCVFTDQVKVSPPANAGSDATLCPGESAVIGTPAIAGATYSWTGAGIVGAANVAQPTVKPTVTTTYTVSATLNGCTTTDQVIVTVNTPNNFAITGNTAICEGGIATLSLAGTAPSNSTWQWSPVAGVSSPNATSTTIAATSTQTYRLTQTNTATGCSNYKEVVVVVNPNTIAATTSDVALCEGTSAPLPLNVTSSGSYSYVWSPSVGLSNAFIANPTVTTGSPRTYTVTVTDNASQCQLVKQVNVAINAPEACFAPVTLTGNVFHDANALKDVTVNSTATDPSIPTGLYVTLVDSTGAAVKTVPVNADGTYDFGVTAPGDYSIVLHQTAAGSTTPSLPSGWVNTGENLGAGVGSDNAVGGILTGVTVAGTNVTNANFGIQLPPVTTGGAEPTQPNPGGTTTVDLTSHFGLSDVDGTVSSITFTEFPENVETITINGTTYVAPGTTPEAGQQVWPAGNVTVPGTGLSVLVDPVDGNVSTSIPFFVTDNGGLESNVSTVTADFTIPVVSLSGNVFHDANALTDSTVNTTSGITIPTGLYASLLDSTGAVVATVPVNADGSYDFGNVTPGTYSVVLHQTAAGSTTPSLPTGWLNTGENLGTAAGSDGIVNGILTGIAV